MPENTPNLDSLFEAAAEIASADERAAYLDKSCGDNLELRKQLEQLLQSEKQPDEGSPDKRTSPEPTTENTAPTSSTGTLKKAMVDAYKLAASY